MPDPNRLCITLQSNGTYSVHDFSEPPQTYSDPFPIKKNGHLHFAVPGGSGGYGVAIVGSDGEGSGAKDPDNPGVVFKAGVGCTNSNSDPSSIQIRKDKATPNGEDIPILLFRVSADGTISLLPTDDLVGGPRMRVVAP